MPSRVRLRSRKRIIRSAETGQAITKHDAVHELSTASRRVLELPNKDALIQALAAGQSVNSIVQWFEREGWLGTMSPSTLTQYIYKFKVECASMLNRKVDSKESYDALIGTSIPDVDEMKELDKLILLQKRRLSMDVATELSIGKLLDNTHKEVGILGELVGLKHKLRNNEDLELAQQTDSTQLRELRVNEGEQDRMQELATQLIQGVKASAKKSKTRKASKLRA